MDPHLEDSTSFVPVLWQLHRPTLWALSQPLQFGGCYSGHPEMASPPSHLTVSLPAPQVSYPSAPTPPGPSCSVPTCPRHHRVSQEVGQHPGVQKLFSQGRVPHLPAAFWDLSHSPHSECCVKSPYFCFSALCAGWAEGCSLWTSSPSAGWFPRSHLAQTRHGCPAPGQRS